MKVYCTLPNGVVLHDDFDRTTPLTEVALQFGVNNVDDDFAAKWFDYHKEHGSPLIDDHSVYELVEDEPVEVDDEDEDEEPVKEQASGAEEPAAAEAGEKEQDQ
jgi:hypothetical protein